MTPTETPTQLRLTHDLLDRADALIAVMATDPEVRALGLPARTAVLRLAIARGLRDLERQYQRPTRRPARRRPTTTPDDAPRPARERIYYAGAQAVWKPRPPAREGSFSHAYAGRNGSGVSTPAPKGS
jgi:hypothetical protein